jgi:hypothetical protein
MLELYFVRTKVVISKSKTLEKVIRAYYGINHLQNIIQMI